MLTRRQLLSLRAAKTGLCLHSRSKVKSIIVACYLMLVISVEAQGLRLYGSLIKEDG